MIKLTVTVTVNPVPAYAKRITNADFDKGEDAGTFHVWPTAHPHVMLERGEPFSLSLMAFPGQGPGKMVVLLTPETVPLNPAFTSIGSSQPAKSAGGTSSGAAPQPQPLPEEAVSYHIRHEGTAPDYWVDLNVAALDKPGTFRWQRGLPTTAGVLAGLPIELTITVLAENLTVTPESLDVGEISISALAGGLSLGRLGVRKALGELHIKKISSTLPFISTTVVTITENKGYIVRISGVSTPGLPTGEFQGKLLIRTDDNTRPEIEVPVKGKLVP
ncbi:MAG TPA: hypothetical protein VJX67_26510 [Blastocatellia bacterium]|nr:hypothetical protein [Blastocatellia bacterium]